MSQISPSGEGIDHVIESGEHQHAPIGERMARSEAQIPYLAREDSVGQLRSEVRQLRTEMVAENKQLRTEMERFATKEDMSKEIHKARNWLMAAMFAMFTMLVTQQLQLWMLQ